MTRIIITILLGSIPFLNLQAQEYEGFKFDEKTGKVIYTAVEEESGDADALYDRAMAWFESFYPNTRGVIQTKDPDGNKIEGKAKFRLMIENEDGVPVKVGFIIYDISIMTRDGRYKYEITNIHLDYVRPFGIEEWMEENNDESVNEQNKKKLEAVKDYFEDLIENLEESMEEEEETEEEDW